MSDQQDMNDFDFWSDLNQARAKIISNHYQQEKADLVQRWGLADGQMVWALSQLFLFQQIGGVMEEPASAAYHLADLVTTRQRKRAKALTAHIKDQYPGAPGVCAILFGRALARWQRSGKLAWKDVEVLANVARKKTSAIVHRVMIIQDN